MRVPRVLRKQEQRRRQRGRQQAEYAAWLRSLHAYRAKKAAIAEAGAAGLGLMIDTFKKETD